MILAERVDRSGALGPEWDPIFAAGPGVQSRRLWFEATEAAAMPENTRPHYVALRQDGQPVGLLPMQTGPGRRMTSLTSPYTILFQPLLAPGVDPAQVGRALGRYLRAWPVTILEALDPAWPGLAPVLAGMARAGLVATRFDHFGNWHDDVSGMDWPAYLASRLPVLRETIRRKGRRAGKDGTLHFEIVRALDGLEPAMAAYEEVYARSWKVPEPFPRFNEALLPRLAAAGMLRLALLWQRDVPVAAQYWTVEDGVATVMKLAHDEAARAQSPGTLVTGFVIRSLLEEGGVATLDFGRGDDDYKQHWVGTRQQRIGVMLTNPLRPTGLAALGRHWAGRWVGHARRALRRPASG